MRLTNKLVSDNYLKTLNRSLSDLTEIAEKVAAHRKFMRVSEDPAAAMRAFRLRSRLGKTRLFASICPACRGCSMRRRARFR